MLEELNQKQEKFSLSSLRKMSPISRKEMNNGLLFLSPW